MPFTFSVGRYTRFALFVFISFVTSFSLQAQECGCTNCPQFMPDNFVGTFLFNVQNAANPLLGQNGQGVCGVSMNIEHEYIGDLSITLTSPAGQTVTLVGPIGFFGFTDGTTWDINFVPCGSTDVAPDPGFSNTWNNNQSWGLGGNYTGTYYPAAGCLQNFNTGSVNGTWRLTVTDGQGEDVGTFFDYEIIFCDPTGIQCFSCNANAGELLQPDLMACEGAATLDLTLPPTYTAPNVAPPAGEYSYTYAIGLGGVFQGYDDNADLTTYPPGMYTVCGISYITAQAALLPQPNGAMTMTQLRTLLNGNASPLCSKMTTNCVNVTIKESPEDTELFETICGPGCYFFNNAPRCVSGTYTANLVQNGCPYTSVLHLTVYPSVTRNLTEIICPGGCSVKPEFADACSPGLHTRIFQTVNGCDSIVNLTLTEMNVNAVIATVPEIPCGGGSVTIFGAGSTGGAGATYTWTASNGGNIISNPNLLNANINSAGDYQLRVCRTVNTTVCCDSVEVNVNAASGTAPNPGPITGPVSVCKGQAVTYSVPSIAGATTYSWTFPAGVTVNSGANTPTVNTTWNGTSGGQVCITAATSCATSAPVCINVALDSVPAIPMPQGPTTVCNSDTSTYTIPAISNATGYTWTVPVPAQIVSGQNTTSIRVVWNGLATANVCVNASNSCGSGVEKCLPVTINTAPSTPVLTGPADACAGSTVAYSVAPVAGATTYNWVITNGTTTSTANTANVTWNSGVSSGTVCVSAVNNCGISTPVCQNVTLGAAPPAAVITGPTGLCPGATATYTITTVPGATGYVWQVPTTATLVSGQGTTSLTVVWNSAPGGDIGMIVNGSCGAAPIVNFPVVVHPVPVANAGPDQTLCGLTTTLAGSGGTGNWTVLSGTGTGTITNPGNASSGFSANMPGTYQLQWTVNTLGCTDQDTVRIVFNGIPVAGAITHQCDNANENYTVSFSITGGSPSYTVPGGTVTNGTFTSALITANQPYQFVVTDMNGCFTPLIEGIYNCNCTTNAGTVSQLPLTACTDDTVTVVTLTPPVLDANDVRIFVLHEGAGGLLVNPIAQNTQGVFTWQPGMTAGQTYYISSVAGNDNNGVPATNDPCRSVSQGQPVIFYAYPVANAGPDLDTCSLSIGLQAVEATVGGAWAVVSTPPGGAGTFSSTTHAHAVFSANLYGTYLLRWTLDNHSCTDSDTVAVTFNSDPVALPATRMCNTTNTGYTVTFGITGGMGSYTVNGTAVVGNTYTSALIASGQPYFFAITDANGCVSDTITGMHICDCTTDAGTMNTTQLRACNGDSITVVHVTGSEVLDGDDVTGYILHDASGNALGNIIAQNTTGTFGFVPGMTLGQTYYVSFVAGNPSGAFPDMNDPCFSVAPGQPVVFLAVPAPDAGPDLAICGNTISMEGVSNAFGGLWSMISGPGTASFAGPNTANSPVTVSASGTYVFRWTETNQICSAYNETTVQFNDAPLVTLVSQDCNNVSTHYTVVLSVEGGQSPYTATGMGGSFSGNIFTSDPIPSNTGYSVVVTDAAGCSAFPITGIRNCNCITDAGTMNTQLREFCVNTPATGIWNDDGALDANDSLRFILHTSGGVTVGQVLAVSDNPVFDYAPIYTPGTTYYISAIAGNYTGGVIDQTDICFSIAAGTPVRWRALPTAQLAGTTAICSGSSATLAFTGTGTFPLTIEWNNGGTTMEQQVSGASGATFAVSPSATTTYTLSGVADGGQPVCSNTANATVTITVNQPVTAGTVTNAPELCPELPSTISLSGLLDGASLGGIWSEISTPPSAGGAFNAANGTFNTNGQQTGIYQFQYTVTPTAPCPIAQQQVTVTIHPQPVADAGLDKIIDCEVLSAILGGNSSSGPGISYEWTNGATVSGNQANLTTEVGGSYTLQVTNSFGCSDTDVAAVTLNNEKPVITGVVKTAISCHGKNDGQLSIIGVTGGLPPYLYSLNGQNFSSQSLFAGLAPGTYQIEVMDANGCELELDFEIQEPEELVVNLGPDTLLRLGDQITLSLNNTVNYPARVETTMLTPSSLDTLLCPTCNGTFTPIYSLQYKLTVVDSNGCRAEDTRFIIVDRTRHIFVPNYFSPGKNNGDINSMLTVFGGNDVERIKSFNIYDRWGNAVHEARNFKPGDQDAGWDGTVKGKPANPAVFVYTLEVLFKDGESELYSGDITVSR